MGLREVEAAATALRDATDTRTQAIRDALAEGLPVADVARAAGLTRQSVYRLTGQWSRTGRSDVEVLDAGLGALLEMPDLPPHAAAEATKALSSSDVLVKARRVQLCSKAAAVTGKQATDELRDAMIVAGRLLSA